jgi:cytochrome c-type biogenesis protein
MVITGIGFLTGAVSNVSIWLLETFSKLAEFRPGHGLTSM